MQGHFTRLDYLAQGNARQRDAYRMLIELGIFHTLERYDPLLVGTIPIDIDLPESDLDIICEVHDLEAFEKLINHTYGQMASYSARQREVGGISRFVANFTYRGWPIEIFAEPIPTAEQNGYRHMIVEHRILQLIREEGKRKIRALKQAGLKTEPAFAQHLHMAGDPYAGLLAMYDWPDEKLRQRVTLAQSDERK
ncbi:DUF4269 domain-containing protein [Paenibacillus guangzhouensis]|uniref:DUF4269 domain-containing protein n=1 Tax=Paenibacillus guangzhouensis TaxID=1473112 RepID=UPI00126698B6|nr:DUF4269 domain-containing protein [Paenibacillus guangzhouensis]